MGGGWCNGCIGMKGGGVKPLESGGGGGFGGVEVTLLSNFHVYTSPTVL